MSGRIRNPNTRISKPAIPREGSIQKPETPQNEASGQDLQRTSPSFTNSVFSKDTLVKLHAFRYHEPAQSLPTDLPETGIAVDTMDRYSIAPEPKPDEDDPQISDHSDDDAGYLYGHIEDDSSQTVNEWNDQNVKVDPCEQPTSQHGNKVSRALPCLPQTNLSNNDGYNCSDDVMANTNKVYDTNEFDEQVDDTTLINIPDSSNLSASDRPDSGASSVSEKCQQAPGSLHEVHDESYVQFLAAVVDESEDEFAASSNTFGNFGVTNDSMTRTGACHDPSVSPALCEDTCPSSATMSAPTSSNLQLSPSHQPQALGRENYTYETPCFEQNLNFSGRKQRIQFSSADSKVVSNVTRVDGLQPTIPPVISTAANKPSAPEVHPKQNLPTLPSQHTGREPKASSRQSPNPRPFLRPPFPNPVPDRSPIQGLSTHTLLRTCFRIGEALNASLSPRKPTSPLPAHLTRPISPWTSPPTRTTSATTLIELYAFVEHSYRSNQSQFFRFVDLFFPSRPPYLSGIWQGWSGNSVFDNDGRVFLGRGGREWKWSSVMTGRKRKNNGQHQGNGGGCPEDEFGGGRKMCRVVGTIDRLSRLNGRDMDDGMGYTSPSASAAERVTMTVWSIWEVGWPDVEYVKGVIEA